VGAKEAKGELVFLKCRKVAGEATLQEEERK
jgi:hypothetical protein